MIRKFWLVNKKNETWEFTDEQFFVFLNSPQGLGFNKQLTLNRYGNVQVIEDMTDNFPSVQGEVIFYDTANEDRYLEYNSFVRFLSYSPLLFYYQLPIDEDEEVEDTYVLECDCTSLTKTESKDNMLRCPITFQGLSFWKGTEVSVTGSGTTYTLTNNGDFPQGFEITIKGTLENPYVLLTKNNDLYGEAKFIDSTSFDEVYINSNDGEQNLLLKQSNSILPNPLSFQDLSISNGSIYVTFVKLARGESTLTIGMDSGSITSVNINFTPIYRSV